MAFRMAQPAHLIDINGIAELSRIAVEDGVLSIGACVRHAAFDTDAVPGTTGALLRKVVRNIAHHPIRTRGTFCGSVAHADPASEWCCVMAALDGVVVVRSSRGVRRLAAGTRAGFQEFSRRKGDFAIAMALVCYRLDNGTMIEPRVAIGGAAAQAR